VDRDFGNVPCLLSARQVAQTLYRLAERRKLNGFVLIRMGCTQQDVFINVRAGLK